MPDRSSKYLPLHRHLLRQHVPELPVSFHEVEAVLGFALPPSARTHPAWWSNNRGTNVAVKAWRDAGWRTSRVDIGAERVTFVREATSTGLTERSDGGAHGAAGVADVGAAFVDDGSIVIRTSALRGGAIRLLEDFSEAHGGGLAEAIVGILNGLVLERRRQLLERFPKTGAPPTVDSADLIREDRDAR
jgi:hypothetical protein